MSYHNSAFPGIDLGETYCKSGLGSVLPDDGLLVGDRKLCFSVDIRTYSAAGISGSDMTVVFLLGSLEDCA